MQAVHWHPLLPFWLLGSDYETIKPKKVYAFSPGVAQQPRSRQDQEVSLQLGGMNSGLTSWFLVCHVHTVPRGPKYPNIEVLLCP